MGIPQDFFDVWGTRKRGREMRAEMARKREDKLREREVRALERIADDRTEAVNQRDGRALYSY